jgi:hypothetical protein
MPCDALCANTISLHYAASDPDHALVVVPGEATDRVALDVFCTHHAGHGVDVWLIDVVGDGRTQAWTEAIQAAGQHVAETVGLPAFVHGSGSRTPATQAAVNSSELFDGAVLLLDSAAPAQVTLPASHNAPPILYVVAGWDTDTNWQLTQAVAAATALPVELDITPTDLDHLLANDYTAHSDTVLDWCLREVSNHLRDGWGQRNTSARTSPALTTPTRRCS